jgi:hypothetical protein
LSSDWSSDVCSSDLKLQIRFFSVFVDMDSVNAMATYRPVEQACVNARLPIFSFSQAQDCSLMMVSA